jgi:hypothetical protein
MTDLITIDNLNKLPYKSHEYSGHKTYESAAAEHQRLHGETPKTVIEYIDPNLGYKRHFIPIEGAEQPNVWSE